MAVAVVKREGESNEKVIGRWKKKTRQARIVQEVREKRYFTRAINITKTKKKAIAREGHRAERKKNRFYS